MSLETFLTAYIEAALWAETDNSTPQGGEPLDANYTRDDIAPQTLEAMRRECTAFYEANAETWYERWSDEEAGHDFWLTRNRHGAGFWARNPGPGSKHIGERLTQASYAAGERDLYIGDDGRVYQSPG